MLKVKGLDFHESHANASIFVDDNLEIRVIRKSDLIKAKKAAGRPKDLDDLENL
jgi:hypothetical protein